MNRVKKVLRKKGIKLACDYPVLPYDVVGRFLEPGHIFIDDVVVNSEKATVTNYLNVIVERRTLQRNGEIITDWPD